MALYTFGQFKNLPLLNSISVSESLNLDDFDIKTILDDNDILCEKNIFYYLLLVDLLY